jgi:hypothetical protein
MRTFYLRLVSRAPATWKPYRTRDVECCGFLAGGFCTPTALEAQGEAREFATHGVLAGCEIALRAPVSLKNGTGAVFERVLLTAALIAVGRCLDIAGRGRSDSDKLFCTRR